MDITIDIKPCAMTNPIDIQAILQPYLVRIRVFGTPNSHVFQEIWMGVQNLPPQFGWLDVYIALNRQVWNEVRLILINKHQEASFGSWGTAGLMVNTVIVLKKHTDGYPPPPAPPTRVFLQQLTLPKFNMSPLKSYKGPQ